MMKNVLALTVVIVATFCAACSGHSTVQPPISGEQYADREVLPVLHDAVAPLATAGTLGTFFEYPLSSVDSNVSYLANGPSNTVWFVCTTKPLRSLGVWYLCDLSPNGTIGMGGVAAPPPPSPPPGYFITSRSYVTDPIISSAGGYFWYEGIARYMTAFCGSACVSGPTISRAYLIRRSLASTAVFPTNEGFRNAILAPDGKIRILGAESLYVTAQSATTAPTQQAQLLPNWGTVWMTCRYEPCSATDPYLYVLATNFVDQSAAVFKLSMTGQLMHTFSLPASSNPRFVTDGPDANLWITENYTAGPSKIAHLNLTTGVVTQYTISGSNVGLGAIAKGADNALWFTESVSNRIGRITTSGALNQYTVPTTASQPNGLIQCPTAVCGAHAGVWFAETAANKIGRYDFP
jgi:hypothetical protein